MQKNNSNRLVWSLCLLLTGMVWAPSAIAEKVYLKSGKVVEGKIVSKADGQIKIDFQGTTVTYYSDEIGRVEENRNGGTADQPKEQDKASPAKVEMYSPTDDMPYWEDVLRKNPDDLEANLQMASAYSALFQWQKAIPYLEKALRLDPVKAGQGGAYSMLAFAQYESGELRKARASVDLALKVSPNDAGMLGLKNSLDKDAEMNGGQLPESVKVQGMEFVQAAMAELLSKKPTTSTGEMEDRVDYGYAQLSFTPPRGWVKETNVSLKGGGSGEIIYYKNPGQPVPTIGVTDDRTDVQRAVDFTRMVRQIFLSKFPAVNIAEPQTVTVAGLEAVIFDMRDDVHHTRSYWYQFLIAGNIVSLQLMAWAEGFDATMAEFNKFAESMKVETR
jgi:hypothetical protein